MAFDNSFVVMNEEEMHDVNGGLYIDSGLIKGISMFVGIASLNLISHVLRRAVAAAVYKIAAFVATLPKIGQIVAAYIFANASMFAQTWTQALRYGKGIEIGFKWSGWFGLIPTPTFTVK